MLIDIVKMFPVSFVNNGVKVLIVDTNNIHDIDIIPQCYPLHYSVNIGNVVLQLSSLDNHIEDLMAICIAEKTLNEFNENSCAHKRTKSYINTKFVCEHNLKYYNRLFGVSYSL